jgi:1-acyl-sn-glycerol-3-phosphate acyltransferase
MYAFLKWIMRSITRTCLVGGLFRLEGLEHVPGSGPLLVCPNHRSTIDPPMVPAFLPRPDTWSMAKSEYFARPGFKRWLFTAYQAFPVVRHTPDRQALKRAHQILEAGHALIVYPEGTRVESGVLEAPEPGAGFLAQRTGVPVLPVALLGTRECFPKGARLPRRVPVTVRFGPTFHLHDRLPDGSRVSHQLASEAIMVRIADLLPDHLRGKFTDLESWRTKVAPAFADTPPPLRRG